ncbi:hypothetical protein Q3G72_019031 [Acer saccharum]|nr:hypothetical protein Q3G72_019031 [Acer saccharum]
MEKNSHPSNLIRSPYDLIRWSKPPYLIQEAEEPEPLGAVNLNGGSGEADTYEMTVEINLMVISGRSGSGQVGRGGFDENRKQQIYSSTDSTSTSGANLICI